ncbi:MAG: TolC family protein [Spirochaetales bacterium]|nr:TolC family protein [Spirochaetales bacterium]
MTGRQRRIIFLLTLTAAVSPTLNADTVKSLTLDECIAYALEYNLELQQEGISLQSAGKAEKNIWLQFLPGLSLGAGASYSDSAAAAASGETDSSIGLSLSAAISVQLGFDLAAEIKNIRLSYALAGISYETARRKIIASVSDSFFRLLLAREKNEVLEENLELVSKQYEKSRILQANGYLSEKTLLQAHLELENARLELSKGQSAFDLLKLELKNVIGMTDKPDLAPAGELETSRFVFDEEKLVSLYLEKDGSIRSAELQIARSENSLLSVSASRLPSLQFSGSLQTRTGDFSEGSFENSFTAGASVNIPLDGWVPGSKTDLKVSDAKTEIIKARFTLLLTRSAAEYRIRSLIATLKQKINEIKIAGLKVSIAEQSYALTEESYGKGTSELLELQEAGSNLLSARLELLGIRYEYLAALSDIQAVLDREDIESTFRQGENNEQ